jgi:hypothetical protein
MYGAYGNLYFNNRESFNMMKNSANALLLQFKEKIKYDMTIPCAGDIKRLLFIFQDGFDGKIINPSNVDCCIPNYSDKPFKLDFEDKFSSIIQGGLELCFMKEDKYDRYPMDIHLRDKSVFGDEDNFFRFREGMREKIQIQVNSYFNKKELSAFEQIGNFIKPYASKLDLAHECSC